MGVRLAGVRKSYRRRGEVLAGIDLELVPGRPVVVVGGNGTGKSTLLRIAAGASAPTAGTVTGRPPVTGFVPGRVPASTRMPVRAYLRHLAAVHGTRQHAGPLLDALGFSGDLDAPVARLSTGNVQKVLLAQALGCRAGLLVQLQQHRVHRGGDAELLAQDVGVRLRGARRDPKPLSYLFVRTACRDQLDHLPLSIGDPRQLPLQRVVHAAKLATPKQGDH